MTYPGEDPYSEIFDHESWTDPVDYMLDRIERGKTTFHFADYFSYARLFDEKIIIPGATVINIDTDAVEKQYLVRRKETVEDVTDMDIPVGQRELHSIANLIEATPKWTPDLVYMPMLKKEVLTDQCAICINRGSLQRFLSTHRINNSELSAYLEKLGMTYSYS